MSEDLSPEKIPTETFAVGSSRYLVSPTMGCRLMKWTLSTVSGDREVLYWPEDHQETPFAKVRGGNPILFPFSGRSYDRGVLHAWRDPHGERRKMPIHGFARQGTFRIAERSDNALTAVLEPDKKAREAYPYDYTFGVRYRFEELAFSVSLILTNLGDERIPWSAGHHFYFNVPWHTGAKRSDYQLHMDSRKCAYPSPDGKLIMERDRETCHDLADVKLLERVHWELRHNRVSFGPKGGEEDVHLIVGKDPVPQKNHSLVTWSESETAPFYCVEPWMGPPNAAEHGKGLHWVAPGEEQSFDVEVSLF